MLPRDGEEAMEETDVEGEGGFVFPIYNKSEYDSPHETKRTLGSKLVNTLVGLLIRFDILRLL